MRVVLSQAANMDDLREMGIPPIGLAYLSAYVKAHEHDISFHCALTVDEILAHEPHVVGMSSVSQNATLANQMARELRERGYDRVILFGGYHITGLPKTLSEDFDAGILGEGEETLLEILRAIRESPSRWKEQLSRIGGLCYHQGGTVITTPARRPIKPLDRIPHPDRKILDEKWPPVHGGVQYIYASRGCPYACSFCSSSSFWGKPRFFSASYVMEELLQVMEEYAPRHFFFYADLFIADRNSLGALSEMIKASGLADEVSCMCNARSNEIDDEVLGLLKKMNVTRVYMGLESASDRVLKAMNKHTSFEKTLSALKLLKNSGIKVTASFILGTPGETTEDMKKTASFIEENLGDLFDEFMVYPLIPFPQTAVWNYAIGRGIISSNIQPEVFRRATFSFHPDTYVYLNQAAPRDSFMFYLYYLRFLRLREWVRRLLRSNYDLGLMMGNSNREIAALKHELEKAGEYARHLEREISNKEQYIDELEKRLLSQTGANEPVGGTASAHKGLEKRQFIDWIKGAWRPGQKR